MIAEVKRRTEIYFLVNLPNQLKTEPIKVRIRATWATEGKRRMVYKIC